MSYTSLEGLELRTVQRQLYGSYDGTHQRPPHPFAKQRTSLVGRILRMIF